MTKLEQNGILVWGAKKTAASETSQEVVHAGVAEIKKSSLTVA
jgi:hypothetical protein